MAERKVSSKASGKDSGEKLIATNPHGRSNYFIDETIECGVVLTGTEVKSLRAQAPNLRDAYVDVAAVKKGPVEAWLVNVHIGPYTHGNIWNHDPVRRRKLLLHRHQVDQMFGAVTLKGQSIIPLRMYFKSGRVKIELGMAKARRNTTNARIRKNAPLIAKWIKPKKAHANGTIKTNYGIHRRKNSQRHFSPANCRNTRFNRLQT